MLVLAFVLVIPVVVPPVADIVNGAVKRQTGCRVWSVIDGDTRSEEHTLNSSH